MIDFRPQRRRYMRCKFCGIFVLPILFFLCAGCASKVVIPPDRALTNDVPHGEVERGEQQCVSGQQLTVSEKLRSQYASWQGVRHRVGGTDRHGVDCSGLMQAIFRSVFQMELPRTSWEQSQLGRKIEKFQEKRPGDLVFFVDRGWDHIGVVVDSRYFLHSSTKYGVMLSEFDAYWTPRLKRISRVLDPR